MEDMLQILLLNTTGSTDLVIITLSLLSDNTELELVVYYTSTVKYQHTNNLRSLMFHIQVNSDVMCVCV